MNVSLSGKASHSKTHLLFIHEFSDVHYVCVDIMPAILFLQ